MANNTDLDPFISAAEKKQDLPPGLLRQIIGEAGTGISPAARKTILDTYGIDAKLNNANAVEAAGILLSDALANNKGDRYGKFKDSTEVIGEDVETLHAEFAPYRERFGLEIEQRK